MNTNNLAELVTLSEAATLLGHNPKGSSNLHKAKSRHADFPQPVRTIGPAKLFNYEEIKKWYESHNKRGRPSNNKN